LVRFIEEAAVSLELPCNTSSSLWKHRCGSIHLSGKGSYWIISPPAIHPFSKQHHYLEDFENTVSLVKRLFEEPETSRDRASKTNKKQAGREIHFKTNVSRHDWRLINDLYATAAFANGTVNDVGYYRSESHAVSTEITSNEFESCTHWG